MIGKKVLLIDNDKEFLDSAVRIFRRIGAKTITATDGLEGIGKLFKHHPDLVILEILLAGLDGIQVCQRIRQFSDTPLIMLSAVDPDKHTLEGLQAGADDVLSKSVNPEVLSARAQAILRRNQRTNSGWAGPVQEDGRPMLNFQDYSVQVGDRVARLTQTEFELLAYLVGNADKVLTYDQILSKVWRRKDCAKEYVHVYISHLRNKIEPDPKQPRYIQSVFGKGYFFETYQDAPPPGAAATAASPTRPVNPSPAL